MGHPVYFFLLYGSAWFSNAQHGSAEIQQGSELKVYLEAPVKIYNPGYCPFVFLGIKASSVIDVIR